jgi:hypothetical protein
MPLIQGSSTPTVENLRSDGGGPDVLGANDAAPRAHRLLRDVPVLDGQTLKGHGFHAVFDPILA